MPRLSSGPMVPGEMRPFLDGTWQHFAAVLCPSCGLQGNVSEQEYRLVASEPDAYLTCRRCHSQFKPVERLSPNTPSWR